MNLVSSSHDHHDQKQYYKIYSDSYQKINDMVATLILITFCHFIPFNGIVKFVGLFY